VLEVQAAVAAVQVQPVTLTWAMVATAATAAFLFITKIER
jgi:hypothetical protein